MGSLQILIHLQVLMILLHSPDETFASFGKYKCCNCSNERVDNVSLCVFVSKAMVSCQMLSELEEVIQYKLVPERRDIIMETWWERLQVNVTHDV